MLFFWNLYGAEPQDFRVLYRSFLTGSSELNKTGSEKQNLLDQARLIFMHTGCSLASKATVIRRLPFQEESISQSIFLFFCHVIETANGEQHYRKLVNEFIVEMGLDEASKASLKQISDREFFGQEKNKNIQDLIFVESLENCLRNFLVDFLISKQEPWAMLYKADIKKDVLQKKEREMLLSKGLTINGSIAIPDAVYRAFMINLCKLDEMRAEVCLNEYRALQRIGTDGDKWACCLLATIFINKAKKCENVLVSLNYLIQAYYLFKKSNKPEIAFEYINVIAHKASAAGESQKAILIFEDAEKTFLVDHFLFFALYTDVYDIPKALAHLKQCTEGWKIDKNMKLGRLSEAASHDKVVTEELKQYLVEICECLLLLESDNNGEEDAVDVDETTESASVAAESASANEEMQHISPEEKKRDKAEKRKSWKKTQRELLVQKAKKAVQEPFKLSRKSVIQKVYNTLEQIFRRASASSQIIDFNAYLRCITAFGGEYDLKNNKYKISLPSKDHPLEKVGVTFDNPHYDGADELCVRSSYHRTLLNLFRHAGYLGMFEFTVQQQPVNDDDSE